MRMLADGPPPHLPGFLNSLAGPLDHFGYWAILLFVMIEDFGVPVPGETILIAAAVYAGAAGSTCSRSASPASWRPSSATTSASPSGITAAPRWALAWGATGAC